MKKYICLNRIDCSWADEVPPREFTLAGNGDETCPNCGKLNIKEKPVPLGPPWKKIAVITGLVLLVLGIIWLSIQPDSLTIQADSNWETRLVTLTSTGGDGSPITYSAEGLKSLRDSTFKIPNNQPKGGTLIFHATQNEETVNFPYKIDCDPIKTGKGENPGGPGDDLGGTTRKVTPVKWTQVAGSDFCVDDCVVEYTERDNLGHTRTRRINNYAKCCPASK